MWIEEFIYKISYQLEHATLDKYCDSIASAYFIDDANGTLGDFLWLITMDGCKSLKTSPKLRSMSSFLSQNVSKVYYFECTCCNSEPAISLCMNEKRGKFMVVSDTDRNFQARA